MRKKKCPLVGCDFTFDHGTVGWFRHICSAANHPQWMPGATDEEKKVAFEAAYPEFFKGSRRHSSRPPPRPSLAPPADLARTVPPPPPSSRPSPSAALDARIRMIAYQVVTEIIGGRD